MNKWIYTIIISAVLAVLFVVSNGKYTSVLPASADSDEPNIAICHANSDDKKPYVSETVDSDSIFKTNGHDSHNGPVWYSGIPNNSWGDIIPPFTYQTYDKVGSHQTCPTQGSSYGSFASGKTCTKVTGGTTKYAYPITVDDYDWATHNYAGKNWTTDGKVFWNNGCSIPVTPTPTIDPCANNACVTATPTQAITPTTAPTVTPTNTPSVTPTVSVTNTPTATPTPTVVPTTTTNNGGGDGLSDGKSSCPECTQTPHTQGVLGASTQAVLGASTMADTGTFTTSLMNFMLTFGMMVVGAGFMFYAKEKKSF